MYLTGIRIKRTKKVGNNMNFKIRNLLAAAMAFVMMISLTACSSDKQKKYEQLKTDIVGVWCDIDGPEYFENEGNPYYKLYEFTSEGGLIYHTPMAMGSVYTEDTYEISDDFLTVGNGAKCRIEIDNDVLTMIYNGGSSQYRKMSMEEPNCQTASRLSVNSAILGLLSQPTGLMPNQESMVLMVPFPENRKRHSTAIATLPPRIDGR